MIRTCTVFTITSQMITSALPPHCVLDAQKLTSALCALEDLDLTLKVSSLDAAEEVLFIPTLKELNLSVVSECVTTVPMLFVVGLDCSAYLLFPVLLQ